ncbi:uncharacterized protein LOC6589953 [Drosophila persimilis]|uniref:Uncharacterized protein n=1 Tax=Drosophila pseudoobscura pseudoobscura TaxID=46245 RepID=A0A6I8VFX7_DROPS|nr:uncharacterized protein LOC26532934 [Drosophila pseudoobscura]XP_026842171.1 uncharacterized protein LOC6589953 [Drosophila persimilis]
MVLCSSCCYYLDLRWGCFWSGVAMIPYYTLMAFLMFDDLEESHEALDENMDARLETHGFWVLGITYTIMGILSFPLLFAGLLNISWLCVAFLVLQIPPVLVNCYYLLVAIMYGIELETFITYGVPQVLVIYIDLVAYSYLEEKRIIANNRKYEAEEVPVA